MLLIQCAIAPLAVRRSVILVLCYIVNSFVQTGSTRLFHEYKIHQKVNCEEKGLAVSSGRGPERIPMFTPRGPSSQGNDRQDSIILAMDHNTSTPYCSSLNCDCHTSVKWYSQVISISQHNEEEVCSTLRWFGIR